jgi:CheY-like chemotaxis protein
MLQRVIGEDVHISLSLTADLPPIHADRGQIEQVIMNLAVNARDAMPDGGTLRFRTGHVTGNQPDDQPGTAPDEYVTLAIADDGCGMTPEIRSHLFEPFFTTKDQGHGTGLGLATVYGIVKQSGGSIRVDTEPGRGTSFTIYFPATVAASVAESAPAGAAPAAGRQERILVVEDDDGLCSLCSRILERSGYVVRTARNADEAIAAFEQAQQPFRLLLTDVIMPGLPGTALADLLVKRQPDLKVLLVSGYLGDRAHAPGGSAPRALLRKPFAPVALLKKVQEVLAA